MTLRNLALGLLAAGVLVTSIAAQDRIQLLRLSASDIDWGENTQEIVRRFLVGDRTKAEMYAYRVRFPERSAGHQRGPSAWPLTGDRWHQASDHESNGSVRRP